MDRTGNSRRVVPKGRRRRRAKRTDGSRALVGVKRLAGMLIQPKQYVDVTLSNTFTTAWTFVNISALAEGDDIGSRSGREITVTQLNIRGGIATEAASTAPMRFRLIVFRDTENRGTVPDDSDVFVGATPGVDALRNFSTQNIGRFVFIWDKYITADKPSATGEVNRAFVFNKKLNYHIQYTGNLDTDEGKNATYFGYCADSVAGSSPTFTAYSRLWYVE